jgi:hypothetical protein
MRRVTGPVCIHPGHLRRTGGKRCQHGVNGAGGRGRMYMGSLARAVRAALMPKYSTWASFPNGVAANVEGVIQWSKI